MVNVWTPFGGIYADVDPYNDDPAEVRQRVTAPEDPNTFDGPYHPKWVNPRRVPKDNLKQPGTSERRATVAGEGAVIPFIYGEDKVGAKICAVQYTNNYWYVLCVWCMGEVEQIVNVYTNGKPTTGVTWTHYLGTTTQTADPTLGSPGNIISGYTDTLTGTYDGNAYGVCYSVAKYPVSMGFLNFEAHIKGLKTYDPRTTTTYWNDNPALALADFIESPVYGMGAQVDWDSVDTTADFCDEVISGTKRRTLDLAFTRRQNTDKVVDQLRTYAGCFVVYRNGYYHLIPNRPTISGGLIVPDYTIGSDKTVAGSVKIATKDPRNAPTVVKVKYTDKTASEWQDREAVAQLGGVETGTVKRRESVVTLPGIDRYSQAYREAVERLNHATLSDLNLTWASFDETMQVEVGDAVSFSDPLGLTNKPVLVTGVKQTAPGRWTFAAEEVQPGMYSDQVETEPTYEDTDLPDPFDPPIVTNLSAVEELYQLQNGTYAVRIRATWDAPTYYSYVKHYDVKVKDSETGEYIFYSTPTSNEFVTPQLREVTSAMGPLTYTVYVTVVSTIGVEGTPGAQDTVVVQGKYSPPSDVSNVTGFEVGGEVRLSWSAAVDLDIWRYEARWGATTDSWDTAKLIDRVDALRLTTRDVPAGTWRFFVKALDSVGLYSPGAVDASGNPTGSWTRDIVVTLDDSAFLVDEVSLESPSLTNTRGFQLNRYDGVTHYVTEPGDTVASMFPSAMSTYTNPLATYHSSTSSEWLSETYDYGVLIAGNWLAEIDMDQYEPTGSITAYLELSEDNSSWDQYSTLTHKGVARYARVRIQTTTDATLVVRTPGVYIWLNAIPREESGVSTSLSSGGKTITLTNDYAYARSITVTPVFDGDTSTSVSATVDNISLTGTTDTFDVYIFNTITGAQVAVDFIWTFKGV